MNILSYTESELCAMPRQQVQHLLNQVVTFISTTDEQIQSRKSSGLPTESLEDELKKARRQYATLYTLPEKPWYNRANA